MKKLGSINELNFTKEQINKLPIHKKVRGLVFKNKNTLVCVEENSHGVENLLGLPCGGVEDKESNIKAFKREVLKETGYRIENIKLIGVIEVVKKRHISYTTCYIAKTKGKKQKINLTEKEIDVNTKPIEIDFKKAIKRIRSEYKKSPNYNSLRSLMILNNILTFSI